MVLFVNKAAQSLNIRENAEFSMSLLEGFDLRFNLESKLFAFIDLPKFEKESNSS